jgi:hypothetical protein
MVQKKPPRKKTLPDVEITVLANSARRCTLCFHLKGDLTEKLGQIAHLDQDRSHRAEDNLSWMCLEHHSLYDSKTKQHKNYTILEVKAARAKLYKIVAEGKHLTPATALPYLQAEADKKVLRDFLEIVPSNGSIRFIRTNNFEFPFRDKSLDDIDFFFNDRNGPDYEFLDPELETVRQKFRGACEALLSVLATQTFPTNNPDWQSVPDDWAEGKDPKRFHRAVDEIHTAAETVCRTYDELVRLARRKLAV